MLLLAQICLWAGGELAPPAKGRLGIWRGLGMTVFLVQTMSVPVTLIQIAWRDLGLMTGFQLAWALCGGLTGLLFIPLTRKRWGVRRSIPQSA